MIETLNKMIAGMVGEQRCFLTPQTTKGSTVVGSSWISWNELVRA